MRRRLPLNYLACVSILSSLQHRIEDVPYDPVLSASFQLYPNLAISGVEVGLRRRGA